MTASPSRRTASRRLIAAAAALVLLLAALAPAAVARSSAPRHGACRTASHHARRSSHGSRCATHKTAAKHPAKSRPTHKVPTTKSGGETGAAPVAARCEDGTLPAREASGAFACDDESEPSCADGSEPLVATGAATPSCPVAAAEGGGESSGGASEGEDGSEGCAAGACIAGEASCRAVAEAASCPVEA